MPPSGIHHRPIGRGAVRCAERATVHLSTTSPDGHVSRLAVPSGRTVILPVGPSGPGAVRMLDVDAPLRMIVQFTAPPIARARRMGMDLEATREGHRSFARDLPSIEAGLAARQQGEWPGVRVLHRLETAFNGVAVSGPPELAERLRALPYVADVFPDDTVRVCLDESVGIIGADQLRQAYG
ncbi:MAG: protease inhibitor I9 family protein, partial [bacterium]